MYTCSLCNMTYNYIEANPHKHACDACTEKYKTHEQTKKPLLTIEVQDLHSVPVVKLNGMVIEGKISISYEWVTGIGQSDKHAYEIKHGAKHNRGASIKTISEERIFIK